MKEIRRHPIRVGIFLLIVAAGICFSILVHFMNEKRLQREQLEIIASGVPVIEEKEVTVVVGGYAELHIPGNEKPITWDSSDWDVCSMDYRKTDYARVYGIKPGTVTITLKLRDGKSAERCTVHVVELPAMDEEYIKVSSGSSFTVNLKGNSLPVEWSSSDPHIELADSDETSATFLTSGRGNGKIFATIQHATVSCDIGVEKLLKICVVDNRWGDCGAVVKYFNRKGIATDFVYSQYVDLNKYDALIVPGGCDIHASWWGEPQDPRAPDLDWYKDSLQLQLIKKFYAAKKPIFGICRGAQLINIALGGSLYQHIPGHRTRTRRYTSVTAVGLMHDVYGETVFTWQFHHQAVKRLGLGLKVTMMAPDGTVEAIEHKKRMIYGTQWHPESTGEDGWKLFAGFFHRVRMSTTFG